METIPLNEKEIQIERLPDGLRSQFLLAIPVPQLLSLYKLSEIIKKDLDNEAFWLEKLRVLRYQLPVDFDKWLTAVYSNPGHRLVLLIELAMFDNQTLIRIKNSLMDLLDLSNDLAEEKVPDFLSDILGEIETAKKQLNEKIATTGELLRTTRELSYQLIVLREQNRPRRKNFFRSPPLPASVDFGGGSYQEMVSAFLKVDSEVGWNSIYLPFLERFLKEGDIFLFNNRPFYLHITDDGEKILQAVTYDSEKYYLPSLIIPLLKKSNVRTLADLCRYFDEISFSGFRYLDKFVNLVDSDGEDLEIEGHTFHVKKEVKSKDKAVPKESHGKSFRSVTGDLFD